ncbi:mismatch repair endonuclease PMS2 [Skeletonema marinoi]|uniref:Mismatch repair endonuclease PMS2 n=1 Tax=Skeletonema marinoi TaxID=267567 RepID=A0AAD8YFA5_9STRA|nr:mismatch repair endonuclease PMS2 [Skeletonema marinoi]
MMEPPTITQEDSAANAAAHQKDSAEHDESEAPLIKPISSSSIKRLVAGQAITDLSSSVKELVDNAIDAGATRISIKLYNQGLECIELIDNGNGVLKSSRPYMAQRHATSKLRQFEDIYTPYAGACAPTLGFRGEALFCLANLSRSLKVSTRTIEDESLGESFCFDTQGELIADSIVPTPRSVGTTVSVVGLMESLPVRRVDMCKRIKAQNMKLMNAIHLYDVATTTAAKNKKTVVRLATSDSSKTMEARVASVLGTKFLAGLTRIELDLQSAVNDNNNDSVAEEKNHGNNMEKWSMSGLISHSPTSPNPGYARDMQFFSINGRPVDLPSVSRVIGDVWRTFDPSIEGSGGGSKRSGRRPACVLAFTLPASMYDVNLAPDKREVMFTEETLIIGCIRDGLMKVWSEQSEGKFRANEVEKRSAVAKAANPVAKLSVTQEPSTQNEEHSSRAEESVVCDDVTPKLTRRNVTASRGDNENGSLVTPFDSSIAKKRRQSSMSTTSPSDKADTRVNEESNSIGNTIPVQHERASPQERRGWEQTQLNFRRIEKQNLRQEMQRMLGPNDDINKRSQHASRVEEYEAPASSIEEAAVPVRPRQSKRPKRKRNDDVTFLDKFAFGSKQEDETESASSEKSESESDEDEKTSPLLDQPQERTVLVGRAASVMETSQASSLSKRRTQQAVVDTGTRRHSAVESSKEPVAPSAETVWGNFAGTCDVILQSQRAYLATKKNSTFLHSSLDKVETKDEDEKESTLSLCKEDIRHMSIIGQFNLGFILARDHNNNLWILDQHACDEKYNFERLCKETVIHEQKLIAPLPLELSPSEEHCVLEHMDIFERNGFRFTYDPEKDQRHRLSVTALPHSGSGADGTSSAEGYIAGFGSGADGSGMVGNNAVRRFAGLAGSHNGSSVMRLPKAIAMFASRACRGSIMIGTALSDKDQKKILNKLDGTDDPWTVPTADHNSDIFWNPKYEKEVKRLVSFGKETPSLFHYGKDPIQGNFDARYAAPAREANQSDKGAGVQCASFVVMQCVLELVCQ